MASLTLPERFRSMPAGAPRRGARVRGGTTREGEVVGCAAGLSPLPLFRIRRVSRRSAITSRLLPPTFCLCTLLPELQKGTPCMNKTSLFLYQTDYFSEPTEKAYSAPLSTRTQCP